jgi:hypothetical protein
MALPEIKHPIFKLKVPSTKKEIRYRPYTVKEEKLLLTSKLSSNIDDVVDTLKQVITNCILDEVDVSKLAMFDIEYIFINLRKVSVSDKVELFVENDGKKLPFEVDLNNVHVKFPKEHTNVIDVDNGIAIKMKYPNMKQILGLENVASLEDTSLIKVDDYIFDMFIDCIESVMDEDKVYSDFTKEELTKFVLNLPSDNNKKIAEFFNTMPSLEHTINVRLPDGKSTEVTLKGLKDFFIF